MGVEQAQVLFQLYSIGPRRLLCGFAADSGEELFRKSVRAWETVSEAGEQLAAARGPAVDEAWGEAGGRTAAVVRNREEGLAVVWVRVKVKTGSDRCVRCR